MEVCSYTHARQNLAEMIDIAGSGDKVVIHRQGKKPVIMISLEEYEQMDETAFLLNSPANARRLNGAIKNIAQGKGKFYSSIDAMMSSTKKRAESKK
jgi:antitoxin YefM